MRLAGILICFVGLLWVVAPVGASTEPPQVRLRIQDEIGAAKLPQEGHAFVAALLRGTISGSPFPYETTWKPGPIILELSWFASEAGNQYSAGGELSFEMKKGVYRITNRRVGEKLEFSVFSEEERREITSIRIPIEKANEPKK
jgi:hypothetical protein